MVKQLLFFLFVSQSLLALPFISDTTRPTMKMISEVVERLNFAEGIPDNQLLGQKAQGLTYEHWLQVMLEKGPELIAAMEKTFPGATWACVGRDMEAIGDLLEAFYLSIGQEGRVARLGVSKPTFQNLDPVMMLKFLENKGLNIPEVQRGHPFIFVDTVSQGYGRQSAEMLDIVYKEYAKSGKNAADLLRKVNIFGLIVSTFQGKANPFQNVEEHLQKNEARLRANPQEDNFKTHTIITFHDPGKTFNEAGYAHYTGAWHDVNGPLVRDGDGKIRSSPGHLSQLNLRKSILWLQRELLANVKKESFLSRVRQEAQKLGYEFPMRRPGDTSGEVIKAIEIPQEIKEFLAKAAEEELRAGFKVSEAEELRLRKTLEEMKKSEDSPKEQLTPNGEKLLAWYRENQPKEEPRRLGVLMIDALRTGRHGLKLRSHDLRTILREVFEKTPVTTSLIEELKAFSDEGKAARDLVRNSSWMKEPPSAQAFEMVCQVIKHSGACATQLKKAE